MTIASPYRPLDDEAVRAQFHRHLGQHNNSDQVFALALVAYREPHRRYHTLEHACEVATAVESLASLVSASETSAALLAAWAHDACYEPTDSDNEARSAELAAEWAVQLGFDEQQIMIVKELIQVSNHRVSPTTTPQKMLCDADLSCLAKPWLDYRDDVQNIRAELHITDRDEWHAIRHMILDFFESKAPLYHLDLSNERWGAAARSNFVEERELLPQR